MNRHLRLAAPVNMEQVLPALDCIGFRQSMRVLKRLEESPQIVEDPDAFILDLVARAGWIFAKPDIINEDEKVAKRVAWLNMFGGLQQPIDFAKVVDSLDGLHVPHAMVLLRELEMQAHKVADPNRFVMDAVNMAGQDKIALPEIEDTLTPIGKRVAELNQSGQLSATLKIGDVKEELAQLSEEEVLEALDEVANRGHSVKDPTGYWKFKLKVRLALQTAAVKVEPVETEKGRKAHFVPRSRAPVAESVVSSKVEHDENEVEEPLEEAQEEEPEAEEEFEVELERREDEDETVQELDFNHEDEDVRSAHQDNEDEAWNWEEDGEDVEQSEWAYETVTVAKQKHNQALREHNPKVAFAAGAAGVEGSRHTTQHKKLTRVVGGVKGCNKLVPKLSLIHI